MRILIYGTGAIGGLIGGHLARAGHEVVCLARERVAQAIASSGLRIVDGSERVAVPSVCAVPTPARAFALGPFDAAVFAMKAYDTEAALDEMLAATPSPPPVLCLQNGIGNEALIEAKLGGGMALAGTVTTAALMPEPGVVHIERERGVGVALGHRLSEPFLNAFRQAGLKARGYPDARAMKWTKVLVNIVANPVSAICDMETGEIFRHPGLYRLEVEALREGVRVMRRMGLRPASLPEVQSALLARAIFLPPRWTQPLLYKAVASGRGNKMPSFHSDLLRGRGHSEVWWLNGAIAREGERLGVPVPVNRALTDTLLGIAEGRIEWAEYRRRPEALFRALN